MCFIDLVATATGSVLARTDLVMGSELLLLRTILVIGILYNMKKYLCKVLAFLYTNIWKLCCLLIALLCVIFSPYASRQLRNTIQLTQLLILGAALWLVILTVLYLSKSFKTHSVRASAAQLPSDLAIRFTDFEMRLWRLERIVRSLAEMNDHINVSAAQADKNISDNSRSSKRKSRLVFKETSENGALTQIPESSLGGMTRNQQDPVDEDMDNLIEEINVSSQRKTRKLTYHRCDHCGAMVPESHKCWVLEQKVTCFKCGQPNHVAMVCKNQQGGMSVKFRGASKVDFVLKEIERLVKIKDLLVKNMNDSAIEPSFRTRRVDPTEGEHTDTTVGTLPARASDAPFAETPASITN
ncbi:putative transmembrane protein [Gregarina niphandrodes]|uniref:Transmembrane protein n=1 Tax=Gregarina niphandrodes TaxID=110365 RepID=A0A023AVU8_GRENI|nr:putative transmembrane protein [Gregarina niphandrodes]EZG42732.1 putative transmembrane protein [Gregarina niphandrodes]|eukprot:XP_011133990.1 putative transmembrane protein [Gregarina niphandrodes]